MATQRAESRLSPAVREALGPDLWTLIDDIGVPVVEAIPITAIPSPGPGRASFRVTLADGRILKGRRVKTATDGDRITRLSALLDGRYFPPVLAHRGCALLTRWVPGSPVSPNRWTSTQMRTCGRLHAGIHQIPFSARIAPLPRRLIDWERRLDQLLGELVAGKALEACQAREVCRLAALSAPATASMGVCHTDFCGDNIIITDVGEVCVVDNEGIGVDSYEYDLARTWYRWPMTSTQQRAYAEGYGAHDHAARFSEHFLHWALMAVIDSAVYRMRVHAANAQIPLDRITELLRTHGESESFPRLLTRG
jgi:Phosphotransferase enzyme family